MKKKAFITGITGQDGSYLAQNLINNDYNVYGLYRRSSSDNFWRLRYLDVFNDSNLKLIEGDLSDLGSIVRILSEIEPDEIYNLAAQSHVGTSFIQPTLTANITAIGCLNLFEAISLLKLKKTKVYQAGSSEMFGKVQQVPQNESTPFYPRSPYGISKLYSHWITINFRESHNFFASNGILFNHESPLRGVNFVTRKISSSLAQIIKGKMDIIQLGNLDSQRDWGFAGDYVDAMRLILNHHEPDDFVVATGQMYSVRDFCKIIFSCANIDLTFEGSGFDEIGIDKKSGKKYIEVSKEYYRPTEVDQLLGDFSKVKNILSWKPKVNIHSLAEMMLESDLKLYA